MRSSSSHSLLRAFQRGASPLVTCRRQNLSRFHQPFRIPRHQARFVRAYSSSLPPSESPFLKADDKSAPAERPAWRPAPHRDPNEPVYELYFTCKVCKDRSGHTISKQGYHNGTVLIQCPGCQNRHLISDHLKIFSDKSVTLEGLLSAQGQAVQKGLADPTSDMEFWEEAATKGGKPRGEDDP